MTPTTAQVVPAVPSFSVDDGFSYAIPDEMDLVVGSVVRVPLGGRRVRGYVTGVRDGSADGLKPVLRRSSKVPVFGDRLLQTLRSIAVHYVAPLSVVLAKTGPPNLPGTPRPPRLPPVTGAPPSPLPDLSGRLADGGHDRPRFLLGRKPWAEPLAGLMAEPLAAGRSVLVVMPTVVEMQALADALEEHFPGRVLSATSSADACELTAVWSMSTRHAGHVVVGTREAAFWPIADLALAVMVGEDRKGMKEKSSPTIHAREVLRRRAAVERFGLVLVGPVPSSETVAAGTPLAHGSRTRVWPLVEIVDRNEEPPGSGFVAGRSRTAIKSVAARDGRVFVFTHRRGYAPAFRCLHCRLVRTCKTCDARAGRSAECTRCGSTLGPCTGCGRSSFEPLGAGVERLTEEVAGFVAAGPVGSIHATWVGTERDLPLVSDVDLAVVVDADGLIHAPNYRAGEDALALLARVAETVGAGSGRRAMVQTGRPDEPVIDALRRGDPLEYLAAQIDARAASGLPPAGEVIVAEVDTAPDADTELRELVGGRADVFGPADRAGRSRWLIQGRDLRPVRIGLRRLVQTWRDAGARVRIDVDPLEL
ncbi:MAG: hypothetical protein HKN74_12695 [Acidimicrobiia bacterium]|nr:hypothetical protein [Acidimicrobiia bacterium]